MNRRWLQYNLRTLLLLTAVSSAGAAYYADQARDYQAEQEAIAQLPFRLLGGDEQWLMAC